MSFVIPTRNQGAFLATCIDSCLAAGVPDAEIIVVDGGSTDDTLAVLARYGDQIRWTSEPDRGQSDAVNKGVRAARGEIIAWINSDDYYAPGAIQRVLAAFDADSEVDIVYGDGTMVDVSGKELRRFPSVVYRSLAELVIHPSGFVMQPALLFRRELFIDVGGLDEQLHFTLDYELFLRMFPRARKVRRLEQEIARAVYHLDAKSIRGMRKQIGEITHVKRRYARELKLSWFDRARLYRGIASLWAYYGASRLGIIKTT
ncbi:MAG TPA: glycosyltransferase family 2 protein [Kofleriaceae bacterium]